MPTLSLTDLPCWCLPLRLRELVLGPGPQAKPGGEGGVVGPLTSIDVTLLIPRWVFPTGNIRYMDELAGNCLMSWFKCIFSCLPLMYRLCSWSMCSCW